MQERASINSKANHMPGWLLEWKTWKLPVDIWHLKVKVALYRSISQGTGNERLRRRETKLGRMIECDKKNT